MAVRFYLGNQTAAVSPAFNSNWEDNTSEVRRTLSRTKIGTNTSRTVAETSATNPFDVGVVQFVSDVTAVRAGTISGDFDVCFAGVESDPAADSFFLYGFAVFSGDGTTSRGGSSFLDGVELPTSTLAQQFTSTLTAPINVQVGDRFVFEVGYRATNAVTTSYSGTVRYGGTDTTDLAAGDTGTNATTRAGWVSIPDAWADLFVTPGTAMLRGTPGATAYLAVEAAWGADLDGDSTTWVWTEITGDVLMDDRIALSHGRADEAGTSQPATCTFTLDNRAGAYSLGGQSSNYPYVRRNTPIRVRVDPDGGGYDTVFQGFADSWNPDWDTTGRYAVVKLSASGSLRRLIQGDTPVMSPFRRTMLKKTDLVAYWPCEEEAGAITIASPLDGVYPMGISAESESPLPKWGECTDFPGSDPLPKVSKTTWRGTVPRYTGTGQIQLRWMARFPRSPLFTDATEHVVLRLYTSGTIGRWDILYDRTSPTGALRLRAYSSAGASLLNLGVNFAADDTARWWSLELTQNGANVDYRWRCVAVGYQTTLNIVGTITSRTVVAARAVIVNPDGDTDDLGFGHITIRTTTGTNFSTDVLPFNAYAFETATDRVTRICSENNIPVTVTGASTVRMGPQPIDGVVKVLRDCETADGGLLYDGVGNGLAYVAGSQRVNPTTTLTLNAATGQVEIEPVDDDQRNRNKVTAKRTAGSEATYEDADGPLGTAAIGIYDTTLTTNIGYQGELIDHAARQVALGTLPGYRYPRLGLQLHRDPTLAATWTGAQPSDRVDVTNLSTVRTQHPTGTVALFAEGYRQNLDQFLWDVDVNVSPYEPLRAGLWVATSGDTGEFVQRLESDGSTLAAGVSAGATSLSVATPSGPLWTTTADDLPFDIEVSGIKITVTAVAGAASPQTFTVTGATVTKALTSGSTVQLWRPVNPGL
jgi:hypothetical protein